MTVAAVSLILTVPAGASASTSAVESYPVSSGVTYTHNTHGGANHVNHLQVNLNDPYTKLSVGLPSPLAKTDATTTLANRDSRDGNRVVGAVNASFFDMKSGLPLYLISQGNEIINGGAISSSPDYYVSQPIAFGVMKDGRAEIDHFNFNVSINHGGTNYKMTGLNRERQAGETIVFTPQNLSKNTNSNEFGIEIVVDTGSPITSTYYGQQLTGNVVKVRDYGSKEKVEIPSTGFVISAHGEKALERLKGIKQGDSVSLSITIDDKWKDSEFMLASGPMLLKDGKPNITMNTNNWRAKATTARTAIAISKDKKQVHLVTVDSRSGYSSGMTLTQFANYLAAQGYDRALNFDGGGSTTMGIRKHGSNTVVLGNRTTNSSQRKVSAIVEAISTAPVSEPGIISVSRGQVGEVLVGATVPLTLNYVLDAYYNPLKADPSQIEVTSDKGKLTGAGMGYTALEAGDDRVNVKYGAATQSFPVKVVDAPAKLTISPSTTKVDPGSTVSFKVNATDAQGKPIVYSPEQVQWGVTGNIGTISSSGVFKASSVPGSGKVTASLGTKTVSVSIDLSDGTPAFKDIPADYAYYTEIRYLKDNGYIKGDIDGKFNPGQTLSREHAAVILSRVFNLDTTQAGAQKFSDVPSTHRYYNEINAIASAGLVGGSNGKFDPSGQLTRAQMAAILVKAYELKGESGKKFKDVPSTHWAYKQIHILANHGITTGNEQGKFEPNKPVNRAQFSAFLYRSMTK
ncbi:S-layer homology domain-containing protein [Sporosarcina cyprini]|uniref:S-layer homology domain-containing protein n=1 Tax=Sporosarcina cyprini TaxID=2910523 RepID=UPI001EDFA724|nr:S-layer homology domain-containing protein [Sporosarcina cyprini]MCG3088178.1 S-layer homology domain-containing protein [Sporosarcina cyprini]